MCFGSQEGTLARFGSQEGTLAHFGSQEGSLSYFNQQRGQFSAPPCPPFCTSLDGGVRHLSGAAVTAEIQK